MRRNTGMLYDENRDEGRAGFVGTGLGALTQAEP